jgi:type VI secretion system protein ImpH
MAALQHLTQRWQGAYFSRLVDRLARSARASGQPLHFVFRTSPSLALKTRDVGSVSVSTIGNVPVCTIDVNFLGLQGVCSPLPTHYTESILFAESPAVLDAFYNYFNQRIIEFSLKVRYSNDMLYRAAHKTNRYTDMVLCASGMQAQVEESPKQAQFVLPYLRYVLGKGPAKSGVCAMVAEHFKVSKAILEEYVPNTYHIPKPECTQLGKHAFGLGETAVVGSCVTEYQSRVRLHLWVEKSIQFLPGTQKMRTLRKLLGLYLDGHIQADVVLHPAKGVKPVLGKAPLYLGCTVALGVSSPLGCVLQG